MPCRESEERQNCSEKSTLGVCVAKKSILGVCVAKKSILGVCVAKKSILDVCVAKKSILGICVAKSSEFRYLHSNCKYRSEKAAETSLYSSKIFFFFSQKNTCFVYTKLLHPDATSSLYFLIIKSYVFPKRPLSYMMYLIVKAHI